MAKINNKRLFLINDAKTVLLLLLFSFVNIFIYIFYKNIFKEDFLMLSLFNLTPLIADFFSLYLKGVLTKNKKIIYYFLGLLLMGTLLYAVIYLQLIKSWHPCVLCEVQRVFLVIDILSLFLMRDKILFLSSVSGFYTAFLQKIEMLEKNNHSFISGICGITPSQSCAVAGSKEILSLPINTYSSIYFIILTIVSIFFLTLHRKNKKAL